MRVFHLPLTCRNPLALAGGGSQNVHAIIDASGTWNDAAQATSIQRMAAAGITMNSTVGITAELQRDWKNPTGAELAGLYSDLAIPFYGTLIALRS